MTPRNGVAHSSSNLLKNRCKSKIDIQFLLVSRRLEISLFGLNFFIKHSQRADFNRVGKNSYFFADKLTNYFEADDATSSFNYQMN